MVQKPWHRRGGASSTRLYRIWATMVKRCERPSHNVYRFYGGRGIRVCAEWKTFAPFREWALANGYAENLTIDRIERAGDYTPSNCRWATREQQVENHTRRLWSPEEIAFVRANYSALGARGCADKLNRTIPAVAYRAQVLGVTRHL